LAWLKIALNDYSTEFVRVYDYLFNLGKENSKHIKELYDEKSYVFENYSSLINIKDKYLSKYDLVTPHTPLVKRYTKFLFDNYEERFLQNKKYLHDLQDKHKVLAKDISDFDMDEFEREREECFNTDWKKKQQEKATEAVASGARATIAVPAEDNDERLIDIEEPDFFELVAGINKQQDEEDAKSQKSANRKRRASMDDHQMQTPKKDAKKFEFMSPQRKSS
jgi:hypothetical protein